MAPAIQLSMRSRQIASLFDRQQAALAQAVLACRSHPGAGSVHKLRAATRRLSALIEKIIADHPHALPLRREAASALRKLKQAHHLAGPVRDMDVHRKRLDLLLQQQKGKALKRSIEELMQWLADRRSLAEERLSRKLKKLETALAFGPLTKRIAHLEGTESSPLATARLTLERTVSRYRRLTPQNLHDLRKRTKAARYLAEMPSPTPLAAKLRSIQDAIGQWHDWALLADEAAAHLGRHDKLHLLLESKRDRSLRRALHVANTLRRCEQTQRKMQRTSF